TGPDKTPHSAATAARVFGGEPSTDRRQQPNVNQRNRRCEKCGLATQQAIVIEIEAEQALVNGNRDLILRFERKIEAAIARVWDHTKVEEAA
ncbi:hypothetical protein GFL58_37000, partial [Rhizobium leguminosarum bv. viciae]|uniref:hypothetical protein n=1 Tax=Rhizobium leguminosarum TaxID=384 RepID=UPI00143F2807